MKRYKVKVQHYHDKSYCIMYSNSYGLVWTEVCYALESMLDNFDEGYTWIPILNHDYDYLVNRAKNEFDTIEKLKSFQANEELKANEYYQRYKARRRKIRGATRIV